MAFTGNYVSTAFVSGLLGADFNFGAGTTDVYKLALYTNTATLNENTLVYTSEGEVVASGYTAGGEVLVPIKGASFVTFDNVSWSGAFTARGALVYKVGGGAVCVLDFGSDKTSSATFTVTFPTASATDALIRLS